MAANITILPANGQPAYPALSVSDVQIAFASGADVLLNGAVVNNTSRETYSGGQYFIDGQPICYYFGNCASMVTPQQTGPNAGTLPTVSVSNPPGPSSTLSDTQASLAQPTALQLSTASTAAAVAPSVSGGLPSGPSSAVGGTVLNNTYRFILQVSGGYATGANLQGCSQTNSAMCDPQYFPDPGGLQAAINYAIQNNQIPYKTLSVTDPWNLMSGAMTINPAQIYNADGSLGGGITGGISTALSQPVGNTGIPMWALVMAGVAAYFLLKK